MGQDGTVLTHLEIFIEKNRDMRLSRLFRLDFFHGLKNINTAFEAS